MAHYKPIMHQGLAANIPVFLYEPNPAESNDEGVLIISSAPWDSMRLSWFYRHLAEQLAQLGYTVTHFDLTGTGASPVPTKDMDWNAWLSDCSQMRDFARKRSRRLHLVGPRLGGRLALIAAQSFAFRSVHLIDPVIDGTTYWRELQHIQSEFLAENSRYDMNHNTEHELLGYPLAPFGDVATTALNMNDFKTRRIRIYTSLGISPTAPLAQQFIEQNRDVIVIETPDRFSWTNFKSLHHQCFCLETTRFIAHHLADS
jgi:pimeloyl-ACP methyl ester carboxylesterase